MLSGEINICVCRPSLITIVSVRCVKRWILWQMISIRNRTEELRSEAAALEEENASLTEKIETPGALEHIKELARELLGLVDPDTIILDPN